MENHKTICICGGGSLGTVIAGIAASKGYSVNILTGHPESWNNEIQVYDKKNKTYSGRLNIISSNAADVIPHSEIVLFCLPGSVINDTLKKIKPFLSTAAFVGSVFSCTGFFIMSISELGINAKLFGCQRVPYIARIKEYGHSASILDYRKNINVAFWAISESEQSYIIHDLSELFCAPVHVLPHALQATLTNSNPILHPSRLFSLFKEFDLKKPMKSIPCFYEDWSDDSSEILIACDHEFQTMLCKLGLNSKYTPSLLEYYESHDVQSLTNKIKSIESLKGLKVPMTVCEGGYAPDWSNRYFTEDIPYGMLLIKNVCELIDISTPNIDKIIVWYQNHMGKTYLIGNKMANSADIKEIACLNNETIQIMLRSLKY